MKIYANFHVAALAALALVAGAVWAAPVSDPDVAASVAAAWAKENKSALSSSGSVVSATAEKDASGTVLWWNVLLSGGDTVIVSPDTDLEPVVASVSGLEGGLIPAAHPLRAMLERDMGRRLAVLAAARGKTASGQTKGGASKAQITLTSAQKAEVDASASASNAKWKKLTPGKTQAAAKGQSIEDGDPAAVMNVLPGFEKDGKLTHWNQTTGTNGRYSLYTPGNCVCGCVAVAGAVVAQYFGVTGLPQQVTRQCTYRGSATTLTTKGGSYDWSQLPPSLGGENASAGENDAAVQEFLSGVVYDMGVCVKMMYDQPDGSGSGAFTTDLADVFKNDYGFKAARAISGGTDGVDPKLYRKLIYAQLWSGGPVVFSIHGTPGGHAVVAGGYGVDADGTEYVRVFMGWGGSGDAWYALPEVESFTVLSGIVTMIGYETDEVVPIYGHCNAPGTAFVTPGAIGADPAVTNYANSAGYFGTRISPNAQPTIRAAMRDSVITAQPFDGAVLADAESTAQQLADATPEDLEISLLNATVAYSVEAAKTLALREGKSILRVSGVAGTEPTQSLLDYIYSTLDENNVNDFTNRYVYFFSSASSAYGDGNPSYGVFDPNSIDSSDLWAWYNGRLAYEAYYADPDTGVAENPEVVETAYFDAAIEKGHYAYRAIADAIVLTVEGPEFASDVTIHGVSTNYQGFGTYSNSFLAGESLAVDAEGVMTNKESTLVYGITGWTVVDGAGTEVASGAGGAAAFVPDAGGVYTLSYAWGTNLVRVTAVSANGTRGTVAPADGWYEYGSEVTVAAIPFNDSNRANVFRNWTIALEDGDEEDWDENPIVLHAESPLKLKAYFAAAPVSSVDTGSYTLSLSSATNAVGEVPTTATAASGTSALAYGANTLAAGMTVVSLSETEYTDSTGGVWKCTGWTGTGSVPASGSGTTAAFELGEASSLAWVWELQGGGEEPEPPEPPAPVQPLEPVMSITIYPTNTMQFAVHATVSNATKDWYYGFVSATSLVGPYAPVAEADIIEGTRFKRATATPEDLDFCIIVDPTAIENNFYKVEMTEEEP